MNPIILNFPPEMEGDIKHQFIQSVNSKLDPIRSEINSWNGFIDLRKISDKDYEFIAICDNDTVRQKMDALLQD